MLTISEIFLNLLGVFGSVILIGLIFIAAGIAATILCMIIRATLAMMRSK